MDFLLDGLLRGFGLLVAGPPTVWSAVWTTVKAALIAMLLAYPAGLAAGFFLAKPGWRGKRIVSLVLDALLSTPTVLIGLIVYAFLSYKGPLGELKLLFTTTGMAVGLALLAFPLVVAVIKSTLEAQDRAVAETWLTLGATRLQTAMGSLREARVGLALAAASAFGRVASEVGIAMMVGGNIKWNTRTITTAIALETGKGDFAEGIALGVVLMTLALFVNCAVTWLKGRS